MDHLTQEQIERYQTGKLGKAQDYREIDAHVAACAYCRDRLFQSAETNATPQTISRLLEGPIYHDHHPSQDVLADYVQSPTGVPPSAAVHIRACEQCQEDIADLRGYLRGLEETRPSKRASGLFGTFRSRLLYGGALAAVAIVILFVLFKSRPVVVIHDGDGRWTVDAWGRLDGPVVLSAALQDAHLRALRDTKLETPAVLASLQGHSETLLRPTGMVILSDRPTLEWKPPPDATAKTEYVCRIVSISKPGFKRPPSKPVKKPSWTLPANKSPLPRGEVYTWKVFAKTNGKLRELTGAVATLPKFKVLEQERVTALEAAKRSYGRSHLTMALLYTQEGLLDEAEREFAALQQANPGSHEIEALYAQLNRLRGATS